MVGRVKIALFNSVLGGAISEINTKLSDDNVQEQRLSWIETSHIEPGGALEKNAYLILNHYIDPLAKLVGAPPPKFQISFQRSPIHDVRAETHFVKDTSAGVALLVSMASALLRSPVSQTVVVTGCIDPPSIAIKEVDPGGLDSKIKAALNSEIYHIVIPDPSRRYEGTEQKQALLDRFPGIRESHNNSSEKLLPITNLDEIWKYAFPAELIYDAVMSNVQLYEAVKKVTSNHTPCSGLLAYMKDNYHRRWEILSKFCEENGSHGFRQTFPSLLGFYLNGHVEPTDFHPELKKILSLRALANSGSLFTLTQYSRMCHIYPSEHSDELLALLTQADEETRSTYGTVIMEKSESVSDLASRTQSEKNEYSQVFEQHQTWVVTEGASGKALNLDGLRVYNLDVAGYNLSNAILRNSVISESSLSDVILSRSRMDQVEAIGVDLQRSTCDNVNWSGIVLKNSSLAYCSFVKSRISDSDLSCSQLHGSDMANSKFTDVNFCGANLSGVLTYFSRFQNCNFQGADIRDADLRYTFFDNCRFGGAMLDGSRLHGAWLIGCELKEYEGLTLNLIAGVNIRNSSLSEQIMDSLDSVKFFITKLVRTISLTFGSLIVMNIIGIAALIYTYMSGSGEKTILTTLAESVRTAAVPLIAATSFFLANRIYNLCMEFSSYPRNFPDGTTVVENSVLGKKIFDWYDEMSFTAYFVKYTRFPVWLILVSGFLPCCYLLIWFFHLLLPNFVYEIVGDDLSFWNVASGAVCLSISLFLPMLIKTTLKSSLEDDSGTGKTIYVHYHEYIDYDILKSYFGQYGRVVSTDWGSDVRDPEANLFQKFWKTHPKGKYRLKVEFGTRVQAVKAQTESDGITLKGQKIFVSRQINS